MASTPTAFVYDYLDYRKYLEKRLATKGEARGLRSRLAEALRVQSAFVSRVMASVADFSPEHGVAINEFLQHSQAEGDYFLLLLHLGRAGSEDLKKVYLRQIESIRAQREKVQERIQVSSQVSREHQMIYYSAWYYAAIHVLILVPDYRSPQPIAERLGLKVSLVSECLEFLVEAGLAKIEKGQFVTSSSQIHLPKNSAMVTKHHSNWRLQALHSMEKKEDRDLFFSGPLCISEKDASELRQRILKFIEESAPLIRDSKEESLYCLNLDYFKI